MSEFKDRVERQRNKLLAEEWANGIKALHAHSLDSVWYGTGRKDGSVLDTEYNDGRVMRKIDKTGEIVWLNLDNVVKGEQLIQAFSRGGV